jgi:hypothetical protein
LNSEKEINFSLKNIKESLSNLWNSKKNSNISKKPTLSGINLIRKTKKYSYFLYILKK